jgi:MoxR-like ATPase
MTAESPPQPSRLAALGVHGFRRVEPVILSALVTEDPLLLIGRSGTGKTYLLNTLSEALGLEHRHYNASLISFDDLVGFPYPEKDGAAVGCRRELVSCRVARRAPIPNRGTQRRRGRILLWRLRRPVFARTWMPASVGQPLMQEHPASA